MVAAEDGASYADLQFIYLYTASLDPKLAHALVSQAKQGPKRFGKLLFLGYLAVMNLLIVAGYALQMSQLAIEAPLPGLQHIKRIRCAIQLESVFDLAAISDTLP